MKTKLKSINYLNIIKRITAYCLGMFIMALGVSVSKASDLGVSPVNSIPCVLSLILDTDMGICTTAVFICFIIVQIIILRREFKWVSLLQIICSTLFGAFVSLSNLLAEMLLPECGGYFIRIVYVLISMALVAFGILLYISSDLIPMPGEGVTQALVGKYGISLSTAKMIFDWSVVIIAALMSLIYFHRFEGVREGTVIAAFGVGLFLKLFTHMCGKRINSFLSAPAANMITSEKGKEEKQKCIL